MRNKLKKLIKEYVVPKCNNCYEKELLTDTNCATCTSYSNWVLSDSSAYKLADEIIEIVYIDDEDDLK